MNKNVIKDIDIKNRTYYFFDDIINIKIFDSNNIKIDEKSYKNILIYYFGYVTIKDSKYEKINSVNLLYLIFSKIRIYYIGYATIKDSKYEKINSGNLLYLIFSKVNECFEEIH